jgi:hypothetical protein
MLKYLACCIILFIIFFCYCHIARIKTVNNALNILQVFDPEPELAYELFENHQPIVFQRELMFWKAFNKFLGKSLYEIKDTISKSNAAINTDANTDTNTDANTDANTNKNINYSEIIKTNLEPYNLPLSYDWEIDIRNLILDDKNGIFFIKQTNYLQCFGCISGEFRIIITPPDQLHKLEPFTNNVSSSDATALLDKEPIELNFIEIIVRAGNLIYIPIYWLYFIYKNTLSSETVIIDCLNKSIISFI